MDTKDDYSLITNLNGHLALINSIVFSPDGSKIATGSFDGSTIIWDVTNNYSQIINLKEDSNWVYSLSFTADNTKIAIGLANG